MTVSTFEVSLMVLTKNDNKHTSVLFTLFANWDILLEILLDDATEHELQQTNFVQVSEHLVKQ